MAAGDEVELAPRDPDPSAVYTWAIERAPTDSRATLGDDPVEHFVPDVAGTYVVRLTAPDGEHDLTIRAFPGGFSSGSGHGSGVSGGRSGRASGGVAGRSGSGVSTRPDADDEGGGRPRLTLQPAVEDDEAVVSPDLGTHPDGNETVDDLDVEYRFDDRDDVDVDRATTRGGELRVPLDALPDRARVYAVAVGEHGYSVPDAVEFVRSDDADATDATAEPGAVTTVRPYEPPAWATDSVIYEIYVREFTGEENDGDTFDAIVDRLDYIESLGVDVLWLTPVLENDHAPHGYNITDFTSIAADLGTRDDYERFLEAAHERGLKVLFDVVCNHSARTHPYFEAAVENPDSEYRDWYEWRTETEPETYFEWEHIANFNFDHLPVRRHLLDAIGQWAPLVDGFRCDMAWAVPNSFWRELHDVCKTIDSEFLLLDETIPYIPDFQAGLFDMHFDSTTYAALRRVGNGENADAILHAIDERAQIGFPDHAAFMLYAENHDETRYVAECGRPAAEAAAGALFTLPGAPLVYAGQEFGQLGRRDQLVWEAADESMQAYVRDLAAVRHGEPALAADADLVSVPYEVADGAPDRVSAYARTTGDAAVVVVLNFGETAATVEVPAAADGTDLVSGDSVVADEPDAVSVDSIAVLSADDASLR